MKLQLTLDTLGIEEGIARAREVSEFVDLIEVGTPVLLEEGMAAVAAVKEAFPDALVVADTKVWHNGERIARSAFAHGADVVSVLGGTTDAQVGEVVEVAKEFGGSVSADMAGVRGHVARASELEDLGVRYLVVPSGFPEANPSATSGQADFSLGTRPFTKNPLALVRNVMRVLTQGAEVAVVDNVTLENLSDVVALRPGVVLVGRAILEARDPVAAASEFRSRIDVAGEG